MSAAILDLPIATPETLVPCADCPALQRLERELGELRREIAQWRCELGYWKSRHADALQRNEQLTEELRQAKGQTRTLRDKLFGRKSEKPTRGDRSNDLSELIESSVPLRKRGAQPARSDRNRRGPCASQTDPPAAAPCRRFRRRASNRAR